MNFKKAVSMLISGIITLSCFTAFAADTPSEWAKPQVYSALEKGLIPLALITNISNYQARISRQDFCYLVVNLYEKMANEELEVPSYHPFDDTFSVEIEKAFNARIVDGMNSGDSSTKKFEPSLPVTREQMAKMLANAVLRYNPKLEIKDSDVTYILTDFNDRKEIQSFARYPVAFMVKYEVIQGRENRTFDPKAYCTVEEAIIMANRIYDKFNDTKENANDKKFVPISTKKPTSSPTPTSTAATKSNLKDEKYNYFDFKTEEEAMEYMTDITVNVWKLGSDGSKTASTLNITVHKYIASEVQQIFEEIFNGKEKFPIKVAQCFAWRAPMSSGRLSEHNLGTAIDINPSENYCVYSSGATTGDYWKPGEDPYSIPQGGDVENAFRRYAWGWGGFDWPESSPKDYMHFSYFGK